MADLFTGFMFTLGAMAAVCFALLAAFVLLVLRLSWQDVRRRAKRRGFP